MGKKHKGDHPLVVAREKAEAAYLAARGQPASVLVPLWEAWSAAQKACINNKPQLKGSAKEIPHPLGKQREGAGTNTTPKPGGQGCSPAALARMCYEVERGTKKWKMGACHGSSLGRDDADRASGRNESWRFCRASMSQKKMSTAHTSWTP